MNNCIHDCTDGFVEATSTTLGKLTKEGLRNAEVIAQVDKKYILIKMRGISTNNEGEEEKGEERVMGENRELLVIVDQHAADERVRVESLFTEVCSSSADPAAEAIHVSDLFQKKLVYRVSQREWELMKRYERRFREWGINYHLSSSVAGRNDGEEFSLHVNSLPRAIVDRCTNEPSLAIDMIRTHVYSLSDAAHPSTSSTSNTDGWVRRIGSCPKGLLDMLNSRACRSAIMFNDPLELAECKVLMSKLGECMFPFQCAHGRPSMIPLVDLGTPEDEIRVLEGEEGGGFMKDFGRWMVKGGQGFGK